MRTLTILLALICVACGSYSTNVPSIKPYKMDIQQGNVVTPKMMMQLRPGMTKSQVRFIMGTPLLVDSFHSDRWDYFYQMRKEGKIIEQRRVIMEFDGDSLARIRGDVIPAGTDAGNALAVPSKTEPKSITRPAKEKDKGLLDKLKFWGDDEEAPAKAPPAEAPKPAPKVEPEPAVVKAAPQPVEEPKQPVTEPAAAKAKEEPVRPEGGEEKKGLLDKLKFWGKDKDAESKPAIKPEGKPKDEAPKAEPAPTAKPAEIPKAEAPKAESPKIELPKSEPVKQPEPAKVAPVPKASAPLEPTSAPKRPSLPDAKPKAPPQPSPDLPSEDAPDFFEKMLEKIGF